MKSLKYEIYETISYINLYRRKQIEKIILQRWLQLFLGFIMIFTGILNILNIISLFATQKYLSSGGLIFCGTLLAGASIWLITMKPEYLTAEILDNKSNRELRNYLTDLKEQENKIIDRGAREWAGLITTIIIFIPAAILLFVKKKSIIWTNQGLDENSTLAFYMLLTFFSLILPSIIALPMTPKKFENEKLKIVNKLTFNYVVMLDDSKINPLNNDKNG